jgi:hypothetical protein
LYTLEKGSKHYLAKKRRNDNAAGVAIIITEILLKEALNAITIMMHV